MPNSASRLLRVAAARADFLDAGPAAAGGVDDVVVASWQRSHDAGVDVTAAHTTFSDDIDPGSLLAGCAQPVLEQLRNDTADMPLVIALTDRRARLVRRIDSSVAVGRLLDRVQFAPGFSYAETAMGTNGVGTVLEAGRPVSVVGPEHFTEHLQSFACSGAPIIDPVTRHVEGVLDISTLTNTWSPIMHALVKSAAKDIAQNLLLDRSQAQQAIFSTYLQATSRSSKRAVFAFGSSLFMANAVAEDLFTPDEQRTLREHATFLMKRRERISDTVVLDRGRHVHITGTRIMIGSDVAGLVTTAEIVSAGEPGCLSTLDDRHLPRAGVSTTQTSKLADTAAQPAESVVAGRSPGWVQACAELENAMSRRQPAVIVGEPGTGKFTLTAEMFHGLYAGARSISVDATQLSTDAVGTDVGSILAGGTGPTLYIVRNIDQLTTDGASQATELLDEITAREGPTWFCATVSDSSLDSDLPFRELLGFFEVSVTVPPLRLRTDDFEQITAAVLRAIAPGRSVRLSPEAKRVLSRYSWPRNISQLREALVHALRRRPVGEIQAGDLPGYCQSATRRTLTPVESSERDLIVNALREHTGNRVAAAESLGMSRSTFYRRIKAYGVTA